MGYSEEREWEIERLRQIQADEAQMIGYSFENQDDISDDCEEVIFVRLTRSGEKRRTIIVTLSCTSADIIPE